MDKWLWDSPKMRLFKGPISLCEKFPTSLSMKKIPDTITINSTIYPPEWLKFFKLTVSSTSKDVEQVEFSCIADGNLNWSCHFRAFFHDSD